MGERGISGACPSLAGSMHTLGLTVSVCVFLLESVIVVRGAAAKVCKVYPLFYSYVIYCLCGFVGMYLVYWLDRGVYSSAYWIYYLVSILAEFMVLAEISDQIFKPFPAIRNLGRALTALISAVFGLLYILPTILGSVSRSRALIDFTLRASVTKAIILVVLFYVARHYGSQLGKHVGGLMLGFSIYVAMNIAVMASAKAFGAALFSSMLWVMGPLAAGFSLLVWTVALWDLSPVPALQTVATATRRDSQAVAIELARYDNELSKLFHK
jgi:hypothetical protein